MSTNFLGVDLVGDKDTETQGDCHYVCAFLSLWLNPLPNTLEETNTHLWTDLRRVWRRADRRAQVD